MAGDRTTKGEREELLRFSRRREQVAMDQAKARSATLLADFEQMMAQEFRADDERWARVIAEVRALAEAANEHICAQVQAAGFPEEVTPLLRLVWLEQGDKLLGGRREELRKVAQTRLAAMERRAISAIKAQSVEFEGLVLAGGLESEAARELLATMPTIEQLMPALDVATVQDQIPGLPDLVKRYGSRAYELDAGYSRP